MLVTLLGLLASLPPEFLNPPTEVERVVARIGEAKEYTIRVSIPGGGESVMRFQSKESNEGATWAGWRVVPYLLPKAIPVDGKGRGQVTLTFEFPGRKEPIVFKSKGLAEDIYLLRSLVAEKDYAKWLATVAPDSKLVSAWPRNDRDVVGEPLKVMPAELAAAVKLGRDAYDAKRPELIRRFNQSYLYYPPAATKDWSVFAGKDALTLQMGCSDLMYAARFRVELKKTSKGGWEVSRILAEEFFKGE
jgi:hypothetical protein